MRLDVLNNDMFLPNGVDEKQKGILAGHIFSQEVINCVMEEVVAHDLRCVSFDDGIHLHYGGSLRRRVGNRGGHFCTQ